MMSSRVASAACALALAAVAWPVTTDADPLTPQQVLRVDFVLPDIPFPFGAPDTLTFGIAVNRIQAIGSYTVSLLDRGTLLGTYSTTVNGQLAGDGLGVPAAFRSPAGTYLAQPSCCFPFPPATVIDFSSFADRTIRGTIELSIATGLLDVQPATLDLFLARSDPNGGAAGSTFTNPIVTSAAITSATPEPSSLILIGTGVGAVVAGRRRRRRR